MKWKIIVVGQPTYYDFVLEQDARNFPSAIRAPSVKSMVDQIVSRVSVSNHDTIASLDVWDHATPDFHMFGNDVLWYPRSSRATGGIPWWEESNRHLVELRRLKNLMTQETKVRFHGCQFGKAKGILQIVSHRLGDVEVAGAVEDQPCLQDTEAFVGPVRRCTGKVCTYTGKGLSDWLSDWLSQAIPGTWYGYN